MRQPRAFQIIMLSGLLTNLTFSIWRGVYNNFAGQELGIGPGQFGLLEGMREIPGLLTILLAATTTRFSEQRLYAACTALVGGGIWLYAGARGFGDLAVATLVQSVGFHLWYVQQDAMILKLAGPRERALRLGQANSAAAVAALAGMVAVWTLGGRLSLRTFFVAAGIASLAAAAVALGLTPARGEARRQRFVFRWSYRSYYILTMLAGARRHVVLTFAAFALVKLYGTPVQTMALLLAAHSLLSVGTRPLIGRVIDRLGEQRALMINYATVAAVFAGYAFFRSPGVVYALFILDNVMTGFDVAISAHAGRLVPRHELSATLAMGGTCNHLLAILVPIVGGMLWEWLGPVVPFLMGMAVALVALAYSWGLGRTAPPARPADAAGS